MALNAVLEPLYLFPRLVLWVAIFAAALADAIRHRNVKVAGYQLQRGIIFVLGAQIIQDSLLVAYSFTLHNGAANTIFLVYIFFLDFSDALFIVSAPRLLQHPRAWEHPLRALGFLALLDCCLSWDPK